MKRNFLLASFMLFIITCLLCCSKSKSVSGSSSNTTTNDKDTTSNAGTTPTKKDTLFSTAYVETNNNNLSSAGCYVYGDSKKNVFKFAIIFAANINLGADGNATLYFNNTVTSTLNSTVIGDLHAKGIKVLLSVLGNHQGAGWSCFSSYDAADQFAQKCAVAVKRYNLDGIDIDDEYSTCTSNTNSLVWAAAALKAELPSGTYVTKALWSDEQYFSAIYNYKKLGDYLDYGWEMSYGNTNYASRINKYVSLGMSKNKLGLGVDVNGSDISTAADYVLQNNLIALMVYNISNSSKDKLSIFTNIFWGSNTVSTCF